MISYQFGANTAAICCRSETVQGGTVSSEIGGRPQIADVMLERNTNVHRAEGQTHLLHSELTFARPEADKGGQRRPQYGWEGQVNLKGSCGEKADLEFRL
jgi:hypothetical protein